MLIPIKVGTTDILYEPDLTAWLHWFTINNIRAFTDINGVVFDDTNKFINGYVSQVETRLDGGATRTFDLPVVVYN